MNLYRDESSYPKIQAQRNLCGRTHYVDDATLRWHKSRILSAHVVDNGLLFAIIESMALDMNNTKRGFRYVIFDVFGSTVDRPSLQDSYRSKQAATKAMWKALNAIDAKAVTIAAANRSAQQYAKEMTDLIATVDKMGAENAA